MWWRRLITRVLCASLLVSRRHCWRSCRPARLLLKAPRASLLVRPQPSTRAGALLLWQPARAPQCRAGSQTARSTRRTLGCAQLSLLLLVWRAWRVSRGKGVGVAYMWDGVSVCEPRLSAICAAFVARSLKNSSTAFAVCLGDRAVWRPCCLSCGVCACACLVLQQTHDGGRLCGDLADVAVQLHDALDLAWLEHHVHGLSAPSASCWSRLWCRSCVCRWLRRGDAHRGGVASLCVGWFFQNQKKSSDDSGAIRSRANEHRRRGNMEGTTGGVLPASVSSPGGLPVGKAAVTAMNELCVALDRALESQDPTSDDHKWLVCSL